MNIKALSSNTKKASHPILIGLSYTFTISIIFAVLFAILLYLTSLSDSYLPMLSYTVTVISLLIGGFISGKKAAIKGWYYGGLTGFLYGAILLMVAFLAFDIDFNLRGLVLIILTFLLGAIGGIFGVNNSK